MKLQMYGTIRGKNRQVWLSKKREWKKYICRVNKYKWHQADGDILSFSGEIANQERLLLVPVASTHWRAAGKCWENCFTINWNWTWSFLERESEKDCVQCHWILVHNVSQLTIDCQKRSQRNVMKVCTQKVNSLNGKSMNKRKNSNKEYYSLNLYKIKMRNIKNIIELDCQTMAMIQSAKTITPARKQRNIKNCIFKERLRKVTLVGKLITKNL